MSNNGIRRMDSGSAASAQIVVPTIIDVPELIVTGDEHDDDDVRQLGDDFFTTGARGGAGNGSAFATTSNSHATSSTWKFVLAGLSYAIGLGNLWRLPYVCQRNGGGAFLVAYTFMLVFVGLPLFLMELAFGQYASEGPITIWRMVSPLFQGIGYAMCLMCALVSVYYNMINAWIVYYLMATITSIFQPLPWSTCSNEWNTDACLSSSSLESSAATAASSSTTTTDDINGTQSQSQQQSPCLATSEYFHRHMLNFNFYTTATSAYQEQQHNFGDTSGANISLASDQADMTPTIEMQFDGELKFDLLICLLIVWCIVFAGLANGIKSLLAASKLAILSVALPYGALFILLVRAMHLPGAHEGIGRLLSPEWSRLAEIDVWRDSATELFFSLSPSFGSIITLAGHQKFHNNFYVDALVMVGGNCVASLLVAGITFATLGHLSFKMPTVHESLASLALTGSGTSVVSSSSSTMAAATTTTTATTTAMENVIMSNTAAHVEADAGLAFVVFSELMQRLVGDGLLAVPITFVFLSMMLLLGLISQLSLVETVVSAVIDTWPRKLRYRKLLLVLLTCVSLALAGSVLATRSGLLLVHLLDQYCGAYPAMMIALAEMIVIAWIYGIDNFMQDIDDMIGTHRSLFPGRQIWYFAWRYLTPSILFAIILLSWIDVTPLVYPPNSRSASSAIGPHAIDVYKFPTWAERLAQGIAISCVLLIPLVALAKLLRAPRGSTLNERVAYLCRPSEDWAPSSYISGPKLIDKHELFASDDSFGTCASASQPLARSLYEPDADSNDDSTEDLKLVDGRANYIIPEDDDADTLANETNV